MAVSMASCSSAAESNETEKPAEITLTPKTKKYLDLIDDKLEVVVYLAGKLPDQLKAIETATRQQLKEFKQYNQQIDFKFAAPFEHADPNKIQAFLKEEDLFASKFATVDNQTEVIRFISGGTVTYKGVKQSFYIIKPNHYSDQTLSKTQQGLDVETVLRNTIRSVVVEKPKIALLQGHGELDSRQSWMLETMLKKYYDVTRISLAGEIDALNGYDGLIVAKPTKKFDEKDIFIIDQFIMNGGKTAWFIDPVNAYEDTLFRTGQSFGLRNDLNLMRPLFAYGVRLNIALVLDQKCASIPMKGKDGKPELKDFYFHPLLQGNKQHTITSNITHPVRSQFAGYMDFVAGDSDVTKTVLLSTAEHSAKLNVPVRINLGITEVSMNPEMMRESNLPVALLLEGVFDSAYENRLPENGARMPDFKHTSEPTKMVVVADGDIVRNDIVPRRGKKGEPMDVYIELQYDLYNKDVTYGNGQFVMNTIDYLMEQ
jgi:ABC-2 type transport system permease protein